MPPSTVYQQQLQYNDASNRLRRQETIYSKEYAELDGLAKQIVDYGINTDSKIVVNYFSESAAQSYGFDKIETEFISDKRIRRKEFIIESISQRTGLAQKIYYYDPSGKIVQVENITTEADAQDKGYDRIVFYYEHEAAPKQPSRVERHYIKTPSNKEELSQFVRFYDTKGLVTKEEQHFSPPFAVNKGVKLAIWYYDKSGIMMTMGEKYISEEFAKRFGVDFLKLYLDEKEQLIRLEYYRNNMLIKTEDK